MQRFLLILGITAIALALLWPVVEKLNLGRLPGDFIFRRLGFTFYFPVTTSIIVSLVITIILWLFRR